MGFGVRGATPPQPRFVLMLSPCVPPATPPRYASLYFCCAIEGQDNELITLELIHRYVELLDKYFGSVSGHRQGWGHPGGDVGLLDHPRAVLEVLGHPEVTPKASWGNVVSARPPQGHAAGAWAS